MLIQFFPWPPKENSSPDRLKRTNWYRLLRATTNSENPDLVEVHYPSGTTVKAKIISRDPVQAVQPTDSRDSAIVGIPVPEGATHLGRNSKC